MPNPAFVHLRLHSEFSSTDGIVRIDDAVARAASDGMPALAITDLANVFGMVKFYKAARASGIKPVIGCDVWVSNEQERDKPYRLLLLVQSLLAQLPQQQPPSCRHCPCCCCCCTKRQQLLALGM